MVHNCTETHSGCEPFQGYPMFKEIVEYADAWKITLMVLDIIMLLVNLLLYLRQAKYMHKYLREKNVNRHQRKMIYTEASVPFVLALSAMTINFAPKTTAIVSAFTSVYFVICVNGFARMIFDYFPTDPESDLDPGIGSAAIELAEKEQKVSYRAFPLTPNMENIFLEFELIEGVQVIFF